MANAVPFPHNYRYIARKVHREGDWVVYDLLSRHRFDRREGFVDYDYPETQGDPRVVLRVGLAGTILGDGRWEVYQVWVFKPEPKGWVLRGRGRRK